MRGSRRWKPANSTWDVVHERHPIRDLSVPRSPQDMASILDALDEALEGGRNVYVHCWGGVGRTGTVVGCWLVRHGLTGDQALAQIAGWWRGVEKSWYHPPIAADTRAARLRPPLDRALTVEEPR